MRLKAATMLTHLIKRVLSMLNSKGTALPGKILSKFYPNFLHDAMKKIEGQKFSVTGTNGKSTTSSILAAILGDRTIHNTEGANMPQGIATSVALGLERLNKTKDLVVETDEAYLKDVFKQIDFDYLIITNLFEDQLDRHGSPIELREKIQEGINLNPNLKIILNADDPILEGIQGEKIYFGLNSLESDVKLGEFDGICDCPKCGAKLQYKNIFYSKVGDYSCSCGFKRPKLDYAADVKIFDDRSEIALNNFTYKINLKGLFNAYNTLGAIVGALSINIKPEQIQNALDGFKPLYGRNYNATVNGKTIKLNLIKNATGASEIIKSFGEVKNSKILIAINNEFPDGRDFSWIYKTSFELLCDPSNTFFVSGSKAAEMADVLTKKGAKNITIEPDLKHAVEKGIEGEGELIALLVFTALAEFEKKF